MAARAPVVSLFSGDHKEESVVEEEGFLDAQLS